MEHQLDMEHRVTEVESRSKSNTKRLDEERALKGARSGRKERRK